MVENLVAGHVTCQSANQIDGLAKLVSRQHRVMLANFRQILVDTFQSTLQQDSMSLVTEDWIFNAAQFTVAEK